MVISTGWVTICPFPVQHAPESVSIWTLKRRLIGGDISFNMMRS